MSEPKIIPFPNPKSEKGITPDHVILALLKKVNEDKTFTSLLIASLCKAKQLAQKQLAPDLFEALQWPVDLVGYTHYLMDLSRWMPQENREEVWKIPGSKNHQEVDDRLNHFYWLIDQEVGPKGTNMVANIPWFSEWLVQYAQSWGEFLNTTDSFNPEILNSFIRYAPNYRIEDSMIDGKPNNPSGWLTFNQFFARELNPGLRPISEPFENTLVTAPADCTYRATYAIGADSAIPEIVIKSTHKFSNITHLLEGSKNKNAFANGTFVHYYLSPFSYHRFHTPVSGKVVECYPIHGLVSLDVNIVNSQFDSPDNAEGGYQFTQARGVLIMDTSDSPYGDVGLVAIIPIGMCQVSSVNMIATVNSELLKGDEFGYFLFGGSDIIVLFQNGVEPQLDKKLQYRLYGTPIATCTILP